VAADKVSVDDLESSDKAALLEMFVNSRAVSESILRQLLDGSELST
jgi:hypothetical protein